MCKAPKPPAPKEPKKPQWLRNPILDGAHGQANAVNQLRTGRSALRIDLDSGLGLTPTPRPTPVAPPPRVGVLPDSLPGLRDRPRRPNVNLR